MTKNVFDEHNARALTDEDLGEIARYVEMWRDLRRDEAEKKIRDLARQMMALSTLLSDDDKTLGRIPSETEEGSASTVRAYAELIHRKLTGPAVSSSPA